MSPSRYLSQMKPWPLATIVFAAIFGGAVAVMSYLYVQAVEQKKFEVRRHARDLAVAGAAMVNLELHESLVHPEQLNSEAYHQVLAPLVKFHHRHPSIQFIWTVRVTPQDEQFLVLLTDTDRTIRREQETLGRKQVDIPFLGPNTETARGRESVPLLRKGQAYVFTDVYTDAFDSYIEARAPLLTADDRFIGYLGVDYALDSYEQQINEIRLAGAVSLLLALLLGLVLAKGAYHMREQSLVNLLAVAEQRDLARKANEAKSELLAIAAHDLKNPLSAIAGMSGLLLKMKRMAPDQAAVKNDLEVLETINSSSQMMFEIVRGILSNEGLEHGGLEFKPQPCDLTAICRALLKFNTPAATKKAIGIDLDLPESLMVSADAKLLREGFDNYLSNAIKYSPPGSRVAVALRTLATTSEVEFSVQDAGPGLSEADQAKLFQKFKKLTPRPTGGESSTGLGLSIVKTIAELHHGHVGCDSQPGQGARFWLRLPAGPIVGKP